jgi:hypothetical protein
MDDFWLATHPTGTMTFTAAQLWLCGWLEQASR